MQYTIRNVSRRLDEAARRRARQEGRSLNETLLSALAQALGVTEAPAKQRDLGGIAGSWLEDPAFDEAVADHERIDRKLWR